MLAEEQHRAQHGEDRRHIAHGPGHRRPQPLVRAHREDRHDDGENAADTSEDQRRVEIEGAPVHEHDRGHPGHDQSAANRVERRAPGRHRPQPELRQDQCQCKAECRTQRQERGGKAGRAAHRLLCPPASRGRTREIWTRSPTGTAPGTRATRQSWARATTPSGWAPWYSTAGAAFEGCGPDLDLHAERVVRSARAIGLNPSKTPEEILKLMHESVRRFGPKAELYVRPDVLGGQGRRRADLGRSRFRAVPALHLYRPDAAGSAADSGPLPLASAGLRRRPRRPTPRQAASIRTPRAALRR